MVTLLLVIHSGVGDSTKMEIYGTLGSVVIDLDDPLRCEYYDQKNNQYHSGNLDFPTPEGEIGQASYWPPAKMSLGPFLNAHTASIYHFLHCIRDGKQSPLNFDEGVKTQEILEVAYLSASRNSEIIKLPLD
ncbi:MAG: hypothetical protein Q7J07_09025 [Pelolinea sp.]|nr:hypothetical protein [Pelolinea sp.]